MKHLFHFYRLPDCRITRELRDDFNASRNQIVIFEFRSGSERVTKEVREATLGLLLPSLRDVGGN